MTALFKTWFHALLLIIMEKTNDEKNINLSEADCGFVTKVSSSPSAPTPQTLIQESAFLTLLQLEWSKLNADFAVLSAMGFIIQPQAITNKPHK